MSISSFPSYKLSCSSQTRSSLVRRYRCDLEEELPVVEREAMKILLNQILQKLIAAKQASQWPVVAWQPRRSPLYTSCRKQRARESKGVCLLLFFPMEPVSGSEWLSGAFWRVRLAASRAASSPSCLPRSSQL